MREGDTVEVRLPPMLATWQRAKLLTDDTHPFKDGRALVELLDSPGLPAPKVWVQPTARSAARW